jgi:uncharacterized protein YbjT (DUF2867 family)
MKVILFGSTGMVGQGVLRECLLDPQIEAILSIGRARTGEQHAKLREIVHADMGNLAPIEDQLRGFDACFFSLGVSSVGMSEADYRHVTYDLAIGAATTLAALNPAMTFIYVSGAGTDNTEHSTERGRTMWARVKGQTENAIIRLPFKGYAFRPAFIQPLHGIKSKTALYRLIYAVLGPLVMKVFPKTSTTTEILGRAMIHVARQGFPKRVLESQDINAAGKS